jgi:O-antigen ligase
MHTRNIGAIDRLFRIAVGAGLIAAALSGGLGGWAWIGLIPLATGIAGSCPLYSLLGFSTCRT